MCEEFKPNTVELSDEEAAKAVGGYNYNNGIIECPNCHVNFERGYERCPSCFCEVKYDDSPTINIEYHEHEQEPLDINSVKNGTDLMQMIREKKHTNTNLQ